MYLHIQCMESFTRTMNSKPRFRLERDGTTKSPKEQREVEIYLKFPMNFLITNFQFFVTKFLVITVLKV